MANINPTYFNRVRYTLSHKQMGSLEITEPDGWNEDEKEFAKIKNREGVYAKFSNNLNFIEEGADFINNVKDFYGINAEISLKREDKHPHTDNWENTYIGFLDLSEWSYEDFKVKVKFNTSGLETLIKSYESEKVEIERETSLNGVALDPLETRLLELPGRKIFLHSEFTEDEENLNIDLPLLSNAFENKTSSHPFPLKIISESEEYIQPPFGGLFLNEEIDASHILYLNNDRNKELELSLKGSFFINPIEIDSVNENESSIKLILTVYSKNVNGVDFDIKNEIDIYNDPNPKNGLRRKVEFDKEITLELKEGDSVSLHFQTKLQNDVFAILYNRFEECRINFTIDNESYFEKSATKVILGHELGERLTQIITGKKGLFYSDYFGRKELGYKEDGEGAYKAFSCGHWIRGFDKFPINDDNKYKPFTTSLKDFVNDCDVTEFLGFGIEKTGFKEKVVVNPVSYFNRNQVLIKLDKQVNNVKRKIAKDIFVSKISIGCEKGYDNEEAMGLDEPNAKTNFTTPIFRIDKEYNKITNYIYASYASEFIRRRPILSYPLEDHTNDKEIFVFDCKFEIFQLQLKFWQDVLEKKPTGVYSPDTAYNLTYSPKHLLLKHKAFIASSLKQYKSDFVRFTSSEGNTNFRTQKIGEIEVQENEDVLASDFGIALNEPEELQFEFEANNELIKKLEGTTVINGKEVRNLYGLIQFINEKGEIEKGRFLSLKPNGKGKWKILKV